MTTKTDTRPRLLRWIASFLFSVLFILHTLLAFFGLELSPLSFLAKLMFRMGLAARTETKAPRPKVIFDLHAVAKHAPAVIRGFFAKVSLSDLMDCAGPDTEVPTHRYDDHRVIREFLSLQELAKSIQAGESTNAKAVTFPNARDFPIFAGFCGGYFLFSVYVCVETPGRRSGEVVTTNSQPSSLMKAKDKR